jgi:arabinose-5-phosphate isomerase
LKPKNFIKDLAKKIIYAESQAISKLNNFIDDDFANSVELILKSKGRVIVSGIGKSALIAQKIVATFNSTGTPAIFMHAADALHGDLGIIQEDDIVICLSKSGNTPEIKVLIPFIKQFGNTIIAIVSNTDSFLAKHSDYVLKAKIDNEAYPSSVAPTSSTTAQLVIGDALAGCLLDCRGFSNEDFARFHPGGSLGKKLYLKVCDIFNESNPPKVLPADSLKKVIFEISSKRLGATAVVDNKNKLLGIITDGDLRRMLEKNIPIEKISATDIMSINPKTIDKNMLALKAFNIMEQYKITQLVVTDKKKYSGLIHLHDILREDIV